MAASPWASLLAWPLITPAERSLLRRLVDCRVDRRRHRAQLSSNELEARTGTDLHESATADPNTDRQLQPDTRVPYTLQLQPRSRDAAHVTLAYFEDNCCRGECCAISPPDYTLGFMLRPVQQNQRAALTAGHPKSGRGVTVRKDRPGCCARGQYANDRAMPSQHTLPCQLPRERRRYSSD